MKLMWSYLKKYKGLCFLNIILVFGFVLIELGLPFVFSQMIDQAILKNQVHQVYYYGIMMVAVIVIGISMSMGLSYVSAKIMSGVITDMRRDLFNKVQHYSHETYEKIGNASLLTRMTNDPVQVVNFLNMLLRMGVTTPIMFFSSLLMIYQASHSLVLVILISLPLLLLGIWLIAHFSGPLSLKQQQVLDQMNGQMQEQLFGVRVIRAFNAQKEESEKFTACNNHLAKQTTTLNLLMALSNPSFYLLFSLVLCAILWFGAKQLNTGTMEVGNYVAITEYVFHVLYSTMLFASVFMMYPRARVSSLRIKEVLSQKETLHGGENMMTEPVKTLEFSDVSFTYPGDDKETLKHLSFTVNKGETVAFVGSIGSGKSSVLKLIARLYDPTAGTITINGQDIKAYQLDSLRHHLGYVPQKAILFNGTIRSNLLDGKSDASEKELWQALALAQAKSFVLEKENQLDETIVEGGSNFSGGQRQRLSIARALVRRPDVLLFDDSFSALDFKTDAKLRQALQPILKETMTFIVAQRLSTVTDADKIIVLEKGEMVACGQHEELLATSQLYREIAESQLKEADFDE